MGLFHGKEIRLRFVARLTFLLAASLVIPACHPVRMGPPAPPADPTNLILTPVSTAQIQLDWTDVATNESSYIIDRSMDGITWTLLAILPANTMTYNDRDLQPSSFYFYRVTAINRGGSSASLSDVTSTLDLAWVGPTTGGPGIRAGHSAIYDSASQRMILFGGFGDTVPGAPVTLGLLNDLWQLSLPDPAGLPTPAWSPLVAAGIAPGPRTGHTAVYDSVNNRMIVFGGQDPSGYLNELWLLTLGASPAWTPVTALGTPPAGRRDHTAVYDPVRREMIVYGGNNNSGPFFGEVRVLSLPALTTGFSWSSPSMSVPKPVGRELHSAIHDPLGPRMVLFAGHDNDIAADGSTMSAETWTLSPTLGYAWSQLSFTATPPLRQAHSAVYDSLNQRMVIFGGGDFPGPLNPPDLWALNLGSPPNWVLMSPFGPAPSGRQHHSAVYDALYHRMLIFGGDLGTTSYTDELWWIVQ
jgi:hypothetical protein